MTLNKVTKLEKNNTATSKKLDYDVNTSNCDAIVIFPTNGQFGPIRKPDIVCNTFGL